MHGEQPARGRDGPVCSPHSAAAQLRERTQLQQLQDQDRHQYRAHRGRRDRGQETSI